MQPDKSGKPRRHKIKATALGAAAAACGPRWWIASQDLPEETANGSLPEGLSVDQKRGLAVPAAFAEPPYLIVEGHRAFQVSKDGIRTGGDDPASTIDVTVVDNVATGGLPSRVP